MHSKYLAILALAGLACNDSKEPLDPIGVPAGVQRQYGAPVSVGGGVARTYILSDEKSGNPVEVGVALDEAALQGLPADGDQGGGMHERHSAYILSLPAGNRTPYRFVELEGVDHWIQERAPDRVNEELLAHLAAHGGLG